MFDHVERERFLKLLLLVYRVDTVDLTMKTVPPVLTPRGE
jgi:hypothetical protein